MANENVKPPLGLRPRFIVAEERAREITAAMSRYFDADKEIPKEWHEELDELNKWLEANGHATFVGFERHKLAS
ncbi:hypothetical protein [Burkholderia phage FLC9]|nr:hypothetical protein [Burkholderia phage FLC9]